MLDNNVFTTINSNQSYDKNQNLIADFISWQVLLTSKNAATKFLKTDLLQFFFVPSCAKLMNYPVRLNNYMRKGKEKGKGNST